MNPDAHRLAEHACRAWARFARALSYKRKYPRAEFGEFFKAVKSYAKATAGELTLHKEVAAHVHCLREYLAHERKRVPGRILFDADRLECILFAGYDPEFHGDEPPGL